MAQALHLMNAATTVEKIQHRDGRAARLAASELPPEKIVEELYLATLSRMPSDEERRVMVEAFSAAQTQTVARSGDRATARHATARVPQQATQEPVEARRAAAEDVLWALLNTKEFAFNH
jgi:hypothetical protein